MKTTPLTMLFLSGACALVASQPMSGSRSFGRGGSRGHEGHARRDLDELYLLKRGIAELSDRLNEAVAKRANIGIVTQDTQAKMKAEDPDGVVPNEEQVHWHTYVPLGVGKRGNIHVVTQDEEAAMAKADPDGVVPNEEEVHRHTYMPLGVGKRGNIHVITQDEEAAMAKADPDGVVPNEEEVHRHTYMPLGVGKREDDEENSIDDDY